MVRQTKDFIRFTSTELENYVNCGSSCIKKISKVLHINFPPYGLGNFKSTLLKLISEKKIGFYDTELDGIILDIRNIKVLGNIGAIRFDDYTIHINIQADCYVFQPKVGAVVQGLVKHKSKKQIGVVMYRVFSVPIRWSEQIDINSIQINSEIEFRIKQFDLQNSLPFIEGELTAREVDIHETKKHIKFESDDEMDEDSKLFKKPQNVTKSACEIVAESENEEIVFSEIAYLNNNEVKKIKSKKMKKQQANTKPSPPKSILKKHVHFSNQNSSSESSDEEDIKRLAQNGFIDNQTTNILKNSSNENLLGNLNILKEENVTDSENSISDNEKNNSDYETKIKKELIDQEQTYLDFSTLSSKTTNMNQFDATLETRSALFNDEIKEESITIEEEQTTTQSFEYIVNEETIHESQITNNNKEIESLKYLMNGYESEDLFADHSQTFSPVQNKTPENEHSTNSKKKNESLTSLTELMENSVNTAIKKKKLTEFLPVSSTQDSNERNSDKSISDASYNRAFKDILEKTRKENLAECEIKSTKITAQNDKKNLSKSKTHQKDLSTEMEAILQRTMKKKLKQEAKKEKSKTLSKNSKSNPEVPEVENENNSKVIKSRKRKLSLNESINDILTKIKMKKISNKS